MALVVRSGKPTPQEVMATVFRDLGEPDDVHWVLLSHGTFYTFPKSEAVANKWTKEDIMDKVTQMCDEATLVSCEDGDSVGVLPYQDMWPNHPTYIVLSCLRQKIGWVVITETEAWAETEQQKAAIGYAARTMYELDCHEKVIVASSL